MPTGCQNRRTHPPNPRPPTTKDEHLEPQDTPQVWLSDLYPGRTFRFGFTNLQIADAVVQFVWSQDDLRPEVEQAHLIRWDDDTYSRDLVNGFRKALRYRGVAELPLVHPIASGVGGFDRPNAFEGATVEGLGEVLNGNPYTKIRTALLPLGASNPLQAVVFCAAGVPSEPRGRVLLAVTGQSQPSRRFLRSLDSLSPDIARRVVVVTGDALPFNTVYRDRQILWSIQDLPFPVVFFCHYNPIDSRRRFSPATGWPTRFQPGSTASDGGQRHR